MLYTAEYNSSARQWDVVDGDGEIVAMCGSGKRGEAAAKRKAANLTHIDECLTIVGNIKEIIAERA